MVHTSIAELIARLIEMSGGNAVQAASAVGTSAASLSRWRSGLTRPKKQQEQRLRALVDNPDDLFSVAKIENVDARLKLLEEAISSTIHALREEFHRSASVSSRQEVLDLVATLFFVHVTSIDTGGRGIGRHLRTKPEMAVGILNRFILDVLNRNLPALAGEETNGGQVGLDRLFVPLTDADERFAEQLLQIFERDASAFHELHESGRDDLINEVFSRFMSTSFVDEKEMGQYLTPSEITRFMVQIGFHALAPEARQRLLDAGPGPCDGIVLDPSCGVGSFLAETIRFCHGVVRRNNDAFAASRWLTRFVERQVVGIDKSERMLRLARINLGLFGANTANLRLANALARDGAEGKICSELNGRVDLILTNPPFGATYSGNDLKGFEIGRQRTKAESEVLFLERYVDWLAPGGVVATVVPDSILVNRNAFAELRTWLRERCSVEAVLSLPPVTFAGAGTSTKTSVLVMRKRGSATVDGPTYFGEAREVGFDVVTRSGQRRRVRNARSDLPGLLTAYQGKNPSNLGRTQDLDKDADRWDAGYHVGLPTNIAAVLNRNDSMLVKVSDVAKLVDERIDPKNRNAHEFDYVEISDVDPRTGLVGHKRIPAAMAPSRARKAIRTGDVLVSTVRPERGAIGVTPSRLDGAICSTGFAVLRCHSINPIALTWLLKTELVRRQMIRNNIGIAYPAISEESCLELILPVKREDINELTVSAVSVASRQDAFESAQEMLLKHIRDLDSAARRTGRASGEAPYFIDGTEPGPISDSA
jgi:SAM-dependent methyltransferase